MPPKEFQPGNFSSGRQEHTLLRGCTLDWRKRVHAKETREASQLWSLWVFHVRAIYPSGKKRGEDFFGALCAFQVMDLGIALGVAAKLAAELNIDNRLMYSAGAAAMTLSHLERIWSSPCRYRSARRIFSLTGHKRGMNPGVALSFNHKSSILSVFLSSLIVGDVIRQMT